ncbi:type 1 glutamine amidotransferase domain-containing protein [Plastoroseomonas hellenica]|uniref:type 1 glutamine amidotransferase domain-containing protein n=1 Tax=Plastoroseomonas hellenica TaxID=2687306 RepID=UPI001BACF33C|nr:type 1 glutamine amidotransferase domain-containing protein [Plastoroseomonas hellenica]MBR0643011.1 type 1 glutamine amidotransferase [Plastoroseomonas hellenica]
MAEQLSGKTIAVLATDGFEQVELTEPVKALRKAGAKVEIVAPKTGQITGFRHFDKGDAVKVDRPVQSADATSYDGLVLPGGAHNPDSLRTNKDALRFVRAFFDTGKPVAAICHAPWVLIDAGVAEGRRMTSYASIRTDLRNAGAEVVDQEVVVDNGLVTSRNPDDLPAFCAKMIEEFAEGRHTARTADWLAR